MLLSPIQAGKHERRWQGASGLLPRPFSWPTLKFPAFCSLRNSIRLVVLFLYFVFQKSCLFLLWQILKTIARCFRSGPSSCLLRNLAFHPVLPPTVEFPTPFLPGCLLHVSWPHNQLRNCCCNNSDKSFIFKEKGATYSGLEVDHWMEVTIFWACGFIYILQSCKKWARGQCLVTIKTTERKTRNSCQK